MNRIIGEEEENFDIQREENKNLGIRTGRKKSSNTSTIW